MLISGFKGLKTHSDVNSHSTPGAPLTNFNDGGGPKDFFGSHILAKRDFLGSMKDAGIFLGRENNTGIFLGIVFFISSSQQ